MLHLPRLPPREDLNETAEEDDPAPRVDTETRAEAEAEEAEAEEEEEEERPVAEEAG